jgi:hypothetical protein
MTATFVTIFAVLLVVAVFLYTATMNKRARASWAAVEGTVIESRVEARNEPGADRPNIRYGARITYQYDVSGRTYHAERIRFGGTSWSPVREVADREAARFPVGAKVTVHYDPQRPESAVLELEGDARKQND